MSTLHLKYCNVDFLGNGCRTTFRDGAALTSVPHSTPHYYVISHRCGYGDNILAYCHEHDFCHAFVEQFLFDRESAVLANAARANTLSGRESAYEEMAAQTLQEWIRAGREPIIAGVDWHGMKSEALKLLDRIK